MKNKNIVRHNYFAIVFCLLILGFYLYAMMEGNAFCDCAKTEKEKISGGRARGGRTFFYHK